MGLQDVKIFPETPDIYEFYRLADILVCTSFEESFPRVLLESAAFRLPIVTTNVNGIPEMLAANEAWRIPPGDRYQLGDAIKQALAAHFAGDTGRADRARAAVLKRFHVDQSLPQHLAVVREAAAARA
jgi:glycosyltransferase involved in cell wall biosynthesis